MKDIDFPQSVENFHKEKDRYVKEMQTVIELAAVMAQEVTEKDRKTGDLKKIIADVENRLKQQQNLYEIVRSDRNLYSKNLMDSQEEISDMKQRLKIMNHQIDQLKQEINLRDTGKSS